ncbi:NLP effector protein 10 [Fulvia fulva]|uniref:NLP effector protein 10 n=1 Tax=Passalora fulva TaxID=5499 RepID=A0A9Q8UWJ8_PASFU|nr:NLP effector protein 10 [Fulvia fulva]KAK4609359.1 NLP effector protein 10 [Fulvia fulva]KAK4609687.1 NLP effector protein 10 [Fulvia fulva]UJO25091.1 NLP effector protein 10 [Fulvia fulva]WPV22821.1 NLP effector protein 10 [Fulvia fulva]WPV37524.1 NLP effector protein 10 [Fulvia fulva]
MKFPSGLLFATVASGAAINRRAVINHDAVAAFSETVPSGTVGNLYLKYKPYLRRESGCVPYPAVDADGNTSGGLNPSGSSTGDCLDSGGQVYARATTHNGAYAIMYSWFWPKDSPSTGLGHRFDWESVVVWLSDESTSATLQGVAASAHGDYDTTTSPNLSGTRPLIRYYNIFPVNHQLGFTSTVGASQPLIAWESLPSAARAALEDTVFGDANVPFKDANFQTNLGKAAL